MNIDCKNARISIGTIIASVAMIAGSFITASPAQAAPQTYEVTAAFTAASAHQAKASTAVSKASKRKCTVAMASQDRDKKYGYLFILVTSNFASNNVYAYARHSGNYVYVHRWTNKATKWKVNIKANGRTFSYVSARVSGVVCPAVRVKHA